MDNFNDLMQNLKDLQSETSCDKYRPEKHLDSLDLDGVASFMKSDKCKSIKCGNVYLFSSLKCY